MGDGGEPRPRAALGARPRSVSCRAAGFVPAGASQQGPPPGRALTLGAAKSGRQKPVAPSASGCEKRRDSSGEAGAGTKRPRRARARNEAKGGGGGNRADEGELPPRREAGLFGCGCCCSGTQPEEPARRRGAGQVAPHPADTLPDLSQRPARKEPGPRSGWPGRTAPRARRP